MNDSYPLSSINNAFERQLKKIADNKDGKYLDHREITVIAHGLLSVLDDIIIVGDREEVELFLKMLAKHHTPHHARCELARQCLKYFKESESGKKQSGTVGGKNSMSPETF